MKTLIVLEHDGHRIRAASLSAIGFARQLDPAGELTLLLLGSDLTELANDAARYGAVLTAESSSLRLPVADRYAATIADVMRIDGFDYLVAASSTFSKDILGRAGGLLGGAMASDVIGHEWKENELLLRRPMYAGAVIATITLSGTPKIITIRPTAYAPAEPSDDAPGEIHAWDRGRQPEPSDYRMEVLDSETKETGRPDVTEARVVVSGGRALRNREDYDRLVGGLADTLGAATGSSRVLVDSGITPNELQVGQTGKIVAPELYVALGISGAMQHLAGMKNSKVIVAINQDPEAPIFQVADYGLVGDIYEIVPQLIKKLSAS